MITGDIQPAEPVVQGKGEIADKASRVVVPTIIKKAGKALDEMVFDNGRFVVKDKGDVEGVGVNKEADGEEKGKRPDNAQKRVSPVSHGFEITTVPEMVTGPPEIVMLPRTLRLPAEER